MAHWEGSGEMFPEKDAVLALLPIPLHSLISNDVL